MKLALWAYGAPAHVGVCKVAASFSGIHAVLRAPKGDGYGTIMLAMFERLGVVPPISVCAMSEATLAGAAANVPAVLREVDARLQPEMIVVTRSATAAVLQEPLDGEIAMLAPGDVKAEIFQASAHPVRDTEVSAFALTLQEIVAHFAADVERSPQPSVNIFGPSLLVALPNRFTVYVFPELASEYKDYAPMVIRAYEESAYPVSLEVFEISQSGIRAIGTFESD